MPWYVQSIVAALLTIVIGGLLIALAPDSTRRRTDRALESPGIAFVYGIVSLVAVIGAAVLLAITVIGIARNSQSATGYGKAFPVATTTGASHS
jgi:uncharacterized protein YjeT (DUF2065 family)